MSANESRGVSLPNYLVPPTIISGYQSWYDMFWELSTERATGMGFGPIPGSAILAAAELMSLHPAERSIFKSIMRSLDNAWMDAMAEKHKPSNKQPDVVHATPLGTGLFDAIFGTGVSAAARAKRAPKARAKHPRDRGVPNGRE